jgi:hypothetical protein
MPLEEQRSPAEAPPGSDLDLSTLPIVEPEDGIFQAYANVVNMDWTLTDVRIRFAELTQAPNDEYPSWKNQHSMLVELAAIRIPWLQAKVLKDVLDGVIRNYEELNGELKRVKLPSAVPPQPPPPK